MKTETPTTASSDQVTTVVTGVTNNPNLVEGKKNFVFSQTGNIMVSTTQDPKDPIEESVREVFNEVSVFFSAMTKAITNTINPLDNQPYSIFNYDALQKIIGGSGCFVEVTKELVQHSSSSFGVTFSKELIVSLLALPGTGAMAFASSMVASIGQEGLRLSGSKETSSSKVGTLMFVCEYLMGMPIITATCMYVDSSTAASTFQAGPCLKTSSTETKMKVHKEVYYFVTPALIKKYSGDLDSIIGSADYGEFISFLKSLLLGQCYVSGIFDSNNKTTDSLVKGQKYTIKGSGFGVEGGLTLAEKEVSCTSWNDSVIEFGVPSEAATGNAVKLVLKDKNKKVLSTQTINVTDK